MRTGFKLNTFRFQSLFFALFFIGCAIFTSITSGIEFNHQNLREQNVLLAIPHNWEITDSEFFQMQSMGKVKGIKDLTFQYRGLHKSLNSYNEKKEYAKGWHDAFILSYKNYNGKIISKASFNSQSKITSFRFIGEYLDPQTNVAMWRMGKLHFGSKHLHALYYTAKKEDFQKILPLFELMESKHDFNYRSH